jgi:large subunit ribosomal protein L4
MDIFMAKIDVLDLKGKRVGSFDLADEVFGAVNEDLLWEAVKHYRAAQRAGTIRSPLWRHGGTVHGPQPRSYDYQFPRKKLMGALRSALAAKFSDGKLVVVREFKLEEPKSKRVREALDALDVVKTALLVDGSAKDGNRNLELGTRNLDGVELVRGNNVHPYHLLRYDRVIFAQAALERLQDSLKASAGKRREKQETGTPARRKRGAVEEVA